MSVIKILTNFNIEIEFESPLFYRRLLAWIIDLAIQFFYLIVALRLYAAYFTGGDGGIDHMYDMQFLGLLILVPFFIYHVVCEITMNGQSLGKKVMGIRVISENGGRAGIGQYLIRWLIRTADFFIFMILLLLPSADRNGGDFYLAFGGALILLFTDIILVNTRRQQRLGDILAHTLLINTRQKESINDTIFLNVSDNYVPSFPQVMRLNDRDINSLRGILDTARRRHDYDLAEMASNKIRNHLKIETSLSPFDFLEILLKDYNYMSTH